MFNPSKIDQWVSYDDIIICNKYDKADGKVTLDLME